MVNILASFFWTYTILCICWVLLFTLYFGDTSEDDMLEGASFEMVTSSEQDDAKPKGASCNPPVLALQL
jgi:hypothetical protein